MKVAARVSITEEQRCFREAIGRFATGVTVITTSTPHGPTGMTASAVSSLSLNPLLLLVCIADHLPTREAVGASGSFAVNVLGEDDEALAIRFATPGIDKFAGVRVRDEVEVPVLERALAYFVCDVHETLPGGDHSIFIGAVRSCAHVANRRPLLYFGSNFGAFRSPDEHLAEAYAWSAAIGM
jgi:flavin reductase (DIM6/NTAB) family NADH-FMN oxidoreductase RutF